MVQCPYIIYMGDIQFAKVNFAGIHFRVNFPIAAH